MRRLRNLSIFLLSFCLTLVVSICLIYNYSLSSVSKNDKKDVLFEIKQGDSSKDIAHKLMKKELIRNDKAFLVYLKINDIKDLKAGYFNLNKTMNVKKIVSTLRKNSNINPNSVNILFKEGINMRGIAKAISETTNNSYDSVFELLNNSEYIDGLIEKYWFLDDSIKNNNIYYPLEGYLYPDTYNFDNKDVSVEEIFTRMLDEEEEVLNKYKDEISKSNYTLHELLTMASIAENEVIEYEDKRNVISIFSNRLNKKMSLGCDSTTYYAVKLDMNERDLKVSELNLENPYNTRGPNMEGKLPVGPICNVSEQSIKAVLNIPETNYLYFVTDKNRKVYYTTNEVEHNAKIKELKNEGLWYEW